MVCLQAGRAPWEQCPASITAEANGKRRGVLDSACVLPLCPLPCVPPLLAVAVQALLWCRLCYIT